MADSPDSLNDIVVRGRLRSYRLEQYLAGGETAAVYRAHVDGETAESNAPDQVVVKLMLPGLDATTQRRFLAEGDTLLALRGHLRDPKLELDYDQTSDPWLVPNLLDQSRSDEQMPFIAINLAEGVSLDKVLRDRENPLPEEDALTIVHQLLTVFVALHEGLERSYYDFQPGNVFWNSQTRSILVVDWNQLSPPGETDFPTDLSVLAGLLYRLVLGRAPMGDTPLELSRPSRWSDLSLEMQALLIDLLTPGTEARASSRAMRARVGESMQRWSQSGDKLLIQASEMAAQLDELEDLPNLPWHRDHGHSEMAAPLDELKDETKWKFIQEVQRLRDLAQRRGISDYMSEVPESLLNRIQPLTEQESWIGRGRTLLNAGDCATAKSLFAQEIRHAVSPSVQLTGWRWWTIARTAARDADTYGSLSEPLDELLAELATLEDRWDYSWPEAIQALENMAWDGTAPLRDELSAYSTILPISNADQEYERTIAEASKTQLEAEIDRIKAGQTALDKLPGALDSHSYSTAAWAWLGSGDASAAQQAVEERLVSLKNRQRRVEQMDQHLAKAETDLAFAIRSIRSEYGGDPYFIGRVLDFCPQWLADAENDARVVQLFAAIQETAYQKNQLERVEELVQVYHKFQEIGFLVECVNLLNRAVDHEEQEETSDGETSPEPEDAPVIFPLGIEKNGSERAASHGDESGTIAESDLARVNEDGLHHDSDMAESSELGTQHG